MDREKREGRKGARAARARARAHGQVGSLCPAFGLAASQGRAYIIPIPTWEPSSFQEGREKPHPFLSFISRSFIWTSAFEYIKARHQVENVPVQGSKKRLSRSGVSAQPPSRMMPHLGLASNTLSLLDAFPFWWLCLSLWRSRLPAELRPEVDITPSSVPAWVLFSPSPVRTG